MPETISCWCDLEVGGKSILEGRGKGERRGGGVGGGVSNCAVVIIKAHHMHT